MPKNNHKKPKMAEVVSIVAHQLKNPLAVLRGYLEVLIEEDFGEINQKQREYLLDAFENVKRMIKTIGNLLDVSKIEVGKYEIKPELINLEEITEGVINDFSFWTKASNCEIIFKKTKEKKLLAKADHFKIHQVIEGLISNAIKYRSLSKGIIKISLKKLGNKILFSCKDNGIGIPKEDFKKVFTKFYRSEKAVEIDPLGSGLGLYINKAIIGLSGGKIWFKHNKNRGTTFNFTLPAAK